MASPRRGGGGAGSGGGTAGSGVGRPAATKRPRLDRAAVDQVWQQLVRDRPGVVDLVGAKMIPTAAIDQNPEQPRRGPLRGIEELAESIAEYGLLQPIVVEAPVGALVPGAGGGIGGAGGRYTLVAGARRLAAYRHLFEKRPDDGDRWATIPAIERDTHTDDRLVLAVLENVSRQNLSEAEIITALRLLRDLKQWGATEIARRLGVTRQWVNMFFRIAEDPELSGHIQAGRLSVAKAQDVRTARTPEARDAALAAALGGAPLRRIREIARDGMGSAGRTSRAGSGGPDRPGGARDAETGPDDREDDAGDEPAHGTPYAAGAATDAAVRDRADLARELGLTADLQDLQLTRLFRAAFRSRTTTVDLHDLMRAMRADGRWLDAVVQAAAQRRRRD